MNQINPINLQNNVNVKNLVWRNWLIKNSVSMNLLTYKLRKTMLKNYVYRGKYE